MNDKKNQFEFLVKKLLEWHAQETGGEENDLSRLKVLKLHFFVAAVSAGTEYDILNDLSFYSLPYGHVESNIYDWIKTDSLEYYTIDSIKTSPKKENDIPEIQNVTTAIERLRSINPTLIKYSAFELVDLSHAWASWAQFSGNRIDNGYITREKKYFSLA